MGFELDQIRVQMDICYGRATSYRDALLAMSHTLPNTEEKVLTSFPKYTSFAKLAAELLNPKEKFPLYKN